MARSDRREDRQPKRAAELLGGVEQCRCKPALSAGTPAFAAVVTPTNTGPKPIERTIMPGSRSERYEPCTGIRESQ
jgi:hypothetical protein